MTENELSKIIVNTAYRIHTRLGAGLLESVCEGIMHYELAKQGLKVERQKPISVIWNEPKMEIEVRTVN